MRTIEIRKKSGGVREIVIPSRQRKKACRAMIPDLQRIANKTCSDAVNGFMELRNTVTNALPHVGYKFTLTMDLESFFDTVTERNCGAKIAQRLGKAKVPELWYKGRAAQGLPTSPIVANLAAAQMDRDIECEIRHGGVATRHMSTPGTGVLFAGHDDRVTMTRYADDIAISYNDPSLNAVLIKLVTTIVERHGFKVNPKKTHLQCATAGRRIICGIAVDDVGVHPTRQTRRKLRAAKHNAQYGKVKTFPRRQWTRYVKTCKHRGVTPMAKAKWVRRWLWQRVRGLEEWIQCKLPSAGRRSALRIATTMDPRDALVRLAERQAGKP